MKKRVGILSVTEPWKGLWRDAETLLWALESGPGLGPVSLFPIAGYGEVEYDPEQARATPTGTPLPDWLATLDAVIVCECLMPQTFELARRRGVRVVYVPNWEWAAVDGDTGLWVETVKRSGAQVWAKAACIERALREAGLAAHLVPWSIPDRVHRRRRVRNSGEPIRFFINAGRGGWGQRRGLDIAMQAFAQARAARSDLVLCIKTMRPLAEYVPPELLTTEGLEVIEGFLSRGQLVKLQDGCDAALHPSRWEGFGFPLLEALHAGLPAIATDGCPMSEIVSSEKNGLLVSARCAGRLGLAPRWECDADALAETMVRFAGDPELRRRLTCGDPDGLEARQREFVAEVSASLAGLD
jgi:glycosyltransferase involved in cell wall biosynthesis